jgi:hypothetical protein
MPLDRRQVRPDGLRHSARLGGFLFKAALGRSFDLHRWVVQRPKPCPAAVAAITGDPAWDRGRHGH